MDAIENITLFMEHKRKYGAMRKASSQVPVATATIVIPILLFGALFLVFASNQVSAEILEVYTKIFNSVGLLSLILLIMALIREVVVDKRIEKLAEENRTPFIERYENLKDYELMSIFNELLEPEVTGYKVVELVDGSLDIIKYKE